MKEKEAEKLQEKHLTNEELYDRIIELLKRNRMRISRKTENSDERNQKVLKKCLTNFRTCDIILKLSETAANSILKIEQCKVNTTLEIPEIGNNLGEVKKVRKD